MAPATGAKGAQALALSGTVGIFTAVWAMEEGDCCQRRGNRRPGRTKQKYRGFKTALWLYKAVGTLSKKQPLWAVGLH